MRIGIFFISISPPISTSPFLHQHLTKEAAWHL